MALALEYLKEILEYEPETGNWFWLQSRGRVMAGMQAGSYSTLGYLYIKIDGQSYIAARLAWFYMTGEWPEDEIDHIDRVPANDIWTNLREADRTANNSNRVVIGISGVPGVYWHERNQKWIAQYNRTYIGTYNTVEEASEARNDYIESVNGAFTTSDMEG